MVHDSRYFGPGQYSIVDMRANTPPSWAQCIGETGANSGGYIAVQCHIRFWPHGWICRTGTGGCKNETYIPYYCAVDCYEQGVIMVLVDSTMSRLSVISGSLASECLCYLRPLSSKD